MNRSLNSLESLTAAGVDPAAAAAVAVIFGLMLVFFGRRIFWIFVGIMGFMAGLKFAPLIAPGQPQWVLLLIGAGLGIVGAVLAVVLQRVAVAIAGGAAGGLMAMRLALELGWTDPTATWIAFIIGAVLAAVIVSLLFDWALIGLTVASGALMVCDGVTFERNVEWAIAAVLVIAGAMVQARSLVQPVAVPVARTS